MKFCNKDISKASKNVSKYAQAEIVQSGDGSHTIFLPNLNETYHSTYGAIEESKHIFIDAGLKTIINSHEEINIFELGFGTGLNAFLTYFEGKNTKINYITVESNPLKESFYSKLNYHKIIDKDNSKEIFLKLHTSDWNRKVAFNENFTIKKINDKVQNIKLENNNFDLVYFDAFSPDLQPELWTEQVFRKIASAMKINGILLTYSAKGSVKRALKNAGFKVEGLPGPTGKREITRARRMV
ncbi:MAG: tRNA (5-methylaminomethyl-2-thiouridine)(34)-methyltransferase MnmD [Bacteroidales bacterium]|nr:tRNA (5-methylaminomethyl-2-thiouridine)(34)-methyltransferase MnmD [Bacteroidales bacterium]